MTVHLLPALVALVVVSCTTPSLVKDGASAEGATTTVIVVRHAEAEQGGSDPSLTEQGRRRAEALAEALEGKPLDAIYTTQFARTRQTAEPLAKRWGIGATTVPAEPASVDSYGAMLAKQILDRDKGKTVLVVGHSNTVPQLVQALTGKKIEPIGHAEHGRLYTVTLHGTAPGVLNEARYGE